MIYVIPTLKKIFGSAEKILNMSFSDYRISDNIRDYFTNEEYEKWRNKVLSKPLP